MVRVLKPNVVTTIEGPSLSPVSRLKTNSQTQHPCWTEGLHIHGVPTSALQGYLQLFVGVTAQETPPV